MTRFLTVYVKTSRPLRASPGLGRLAIDVGTRPSWTVRPPGWSDDEFGRFEIDRRKLADSDDRLAKHRSALEAGADPTVVRSWISEVQGERLAAERALAAAQPSGRALTPDELRAVIEGMEDIAAVPDGLTCQQADQRLAAR